MCLSFFPSFSFLTLSFHFSLSPSFYLFVFQKDIECLQNEPKISWSHYIYSQRSLGNIESPDWQAGSYLHNCYRSCGKNSDGNVGISGLVTWPGTPENTRKRMVKPKRRADDCHWSPENIYLEVTLSRKKCPVVRGGLRNYKEHRVMLHILVLSQQRGCRM